MEDKRPPAPQQSAPSVAVLFLVFMFCWPLALVMAYNAGYFHRDGKLDPVNLVFAVIGAALMLYMAIAIVVSIGF